ncbi:Recombinase [Polystyrenella longa]|uniref:Recombinase n=1 Tax=Polystyrenella longa TaxID=2528007 RepID=A0A518CK82_9PLAN|nr:recombinase family protein [Polystyrenella longa]QDU79631.1 Recombinase [Polystyrenella longa]
MKGFSNNSDSTKSSKTNSSGLYLTKSEKQQLRKGLPSKDALLAMARTYLEVQNEHWPEYVTSGLLPLATVENIEVFASDFESSFLSGDQSFPRSTLKQAACVYLRYSDDNSNERSLAQQLKNILLKANQDRRFVEWHHICADAAVSATTPRRAGYQKLLSWMRNYAAQIELVYVDDLSRLNRNMTESMKLNDIASDENIRLIGVKDGIETSNPSSRLIHAVTSWQHENFITGLQEKVKRGMNDRFEQGGNLQPPSFGYKLIMLRDADGEPKLSRHGKPIMEKLVDQEEAVWVRQIFEWFVVKNWSRQKIAKELNSKGIGGKRTWDSRKIMQLLERSVYRGIECYGMTVQQRNHNTGKVTVIQKPESEWQKRDVPHLRIVSDDTWDRTQIQLKKIRASYTARIRKPRGNRTTLSPSLLIRPVCGYCGARLLLAHSSKYQSLSCMNGREKKHDCQLTTHKSVRILNRAILAKLHEEILTKEFLRGLFKQANKELKILLNEPAEDLTPLKKKLEMLLKQEAKLATLLTKEDDLTAITDALRTIQAEREGLERRLGEAERHSSTAPGPIDPKFAIKCLKDIEALLKEDVSYAAPILEALTGPIRITQGEQVPGKRSAVWQAEFTINTTQFMVELSRAKKYPNTGTWEFLNTRGWTISRTVSLEVKEVPRYVSRGKEYSELQNFGLSTGEIAKKVGMNERYVSAAIDSFRNGTTPDWKKFDSGTIPRGPSKPLLSELILDDVVRLRKEENMAFRKIAAWLKEHLSIKVSAQTVKRTWDKAAVQ